MLPSSRQIDAEDHIEQVREDALLALEDSNEDDSEVYLPEPNFAATIAAGVILVIIGLIVIGSSPSVGIGVAVFGIMICIGGFASRKVEYDSGSDYFPMTDEINDMQEEYDWETEARGKQLARQQEIDDIVKAVKQTIRIRCRYCGTLNEESANKCESCGANL